MPTKTSKQRGRPRLDPQRVKLRQSWNDQKHRATQRNIDFLFTFEEWLKFWKDSGKLHLRGRGKGRYCMMRKGDKGSYSIGNVLIGLFTDNSREGSIMNAAAERLNSIPRLKSPTKGKKCLTHLESGTIIYVDSKDKRMNDEKYKKGRWLKQQDS